MSGIETKVFGKAHEVTIGGGRYETGSLAVAASGKVVQGDLLARDAGGGFKPYTGVAESGVIAPPVAVYTEAAELSGGTSGATFAIAALIAGEIRRNAVKVAGVAATAAQLDEMKAAGIVPVEISEVNLEEIE